MNNRPVGDWSIFRLGKEFGESTQAENMDLSPLTNLER
jgi:hypothetical protein